MQKQSVWLKHTHMLVLFDIVSWYNFQATKYFLVCLHCFELFTKVKIKQSLRFILNFQERFYVNSITLHAYIKLCHIVPKQYEVVGSICALPHSYFTRTILNLIYKMFPWENATREESITHERQRITQVAFSRKDVLSLKNIKASF